MEDLTRLIISHERIENIKNNNLELSKEEAHYINKVMRIKNGKEIFIANGKGSLWKAIKVKNDCLEIIQLKKPYLFREQEIHLLGIAVVVPKSGFEDILKMSTEIGIDIIQPLITDRQIKRLKNLSVKELRWDTILNESVEQCERLWKPKLLKCLTISNWIPTVIEKDFISISVTRIDNSKSLKNWLKEIEYSSIKENKIVWNVIGPEGGWSHNEITSFLEYKIQFVKLSDTILRTPTAAISASFILNQWRNEKFKIY